MHSPHNSLELFLCDAKGDPCVGPLVEGEYLPRMRRNSHVPILNISTRSLVPIHKVDYCRRWPVAYIKVIKDDALGKVTQGELVTMPDDSGFR